MLCWQQMLGVVTGLVLAAAVLSTTGRWYPGDADHVTAGPILSECDGAIRSVVIQYVPQADFAAGVYRDLLRQVPDDWIVHAVCPDAATYEELQRRVGEVRCRIEPVLTHHPMTAWSRDRWTALMPAQAGGRAVLLAPRGEAGAETWAARAGDQRIAFDLASAKAGAIAARRSELYFDGGDLMADAETVFITPAVLARNIQRTVRNREELLQVLGRETKRRVALMDDAPDHHAGMFMAVVGERRVVVGDPAMGKTLYDTLPGAPPLAGGADFTAETQSRFDAVARYADAAGYRVVRIPVVPGMDHKAYLTYVNVLIDQQDGRRIAYMPVYHGADAMNAAARQVWEKLGYEVKPVDCTGVYANFGCLHCLVNVVIRS